MKVDIVYTTKSKYIKCVAQEMAKCARTCAKNLQVYQNDTPSDLLVICFDDTLLDDHELIRFIESISRNQVKNLAIAHCFFVNDKKLKKVIKLCQNQRLPLMREQYTFKMTFAQRKEIHPTIIDNARLYIEDMINVIRDYY
ncbi:MAG: hypothetical protein ACI4SR_01660 [Faecalibacillus sp.]